LGSQKEIFIYSVDYDLRGIDRNSGCIVIVRPDQHILDQQLVETTD